MVSVWDIIYNFRNFRMMLSDIMLNIKQYNYIYDLYKKEVIEVVPEEEKSWVILKTSNFIENDFKDIKIEVHALAFFHFKFKGQVIKEGRKLFKDVNDVSKDFILSKEDLIPSYNGGKLYTLTYESYKKIIERTRPIDSLKIRLLAIDLYDTLTSNRSELTKHGLCLLENIEKRG